MRGVERARMYIIPVCVCLSVCLCLPEPGIELNGRAIACVYLGWKFDANTVPVAENRRSNLNQGVPTNIAESSAQKKKPALVLNHAAYMSGKKIRASFFFSCVREGEVSSRVRGRKKKL